MRKTILAGLIGLAAYSFYHHNQPAIDEAYGPVFRLVGERLKCRTTRHLQGATLTTCNVCATSRGSDSTCTATYYDGGLDDARGGR